MNILDPIFLSHIVLRFSPSDLPEGVVWPRRPPPRSGACLPWFLMHLALSFLTFLSQNKINSLSCKHVLTGGREEIIVFKQTFHPSDIQTRPPVGLLAIHLFNDLELCYSGSLKLTLMSNQPKNGNLRAT